MVGHSCIYIKLNDSNRQWLGKSIVWLYYMSTRINPIQRQFDVNHNDDYIVVVTTIFNENVKGSKLSVFHNAPCHCILPTNEANEIWQLTAAKRQLWNCSNFRCRITCVISWNELIREKILNLQSCNVPWDKVRWSMNDLVCYEQPSIL